MMKWAITTALSNSNYGVINMPNFYNFILAVMDKNTDEENEQLIDALIVNMGRTVYKDLKIYVCEKIPDSRHMLLLNKKV
jgi:hypothetical protein